MTRLTVLFAAAAGPRRGFGHLVRSGVLADALGVKRVIVLRGSSATRAAVRGLGWTVHTDLPSLLKRVQPDLLVVDDPSPAHAGTAVRQARRLRIPVASIHDLGFGLLSSDLSIDGSVAARRPAGAAMADLRGPAYAVLHPSVLAVRRQHLAREPRTVLVALGGGAHISAYGPGVAARIAAAMPDAIVELAVGFDPDRSATPLPPGCRWLHSPDGLATALARASVAVVGGGVTLYEAAALGTPAVALAVVPAQRPTVRAFASAGAAIGVTCSRRATAVAEVARAAVALLNQPMTARKLSRRGPRIVDGRGADRVVAALRALRAIGQRRGRWPHAA